MLSRLRLQVLILAAFFAAAAGLVLARQELLRRYADAVHTPRNREIMRFFERNQAVLRSKPAGEKMRDRMGGLVDFMVERDWPLTAQIRGALAVFALHTSLFAIRDPEVGDEERRSAAQARTTASNSGCALNAVSNTTSGLHA